MNDKPLKLPKLLLAEIITHALERDPEECCGILLGRGNTVTQLRRIRNIHDSGVNRFKMDPFDVIEAERDARGAGEKFVAIYHSHTYSEGHVGIIIWALDGPSSRLGIGPQERSLYPIVSTAASITS